MSMNVYKQLQVLHDSLRIAGNNSKLLDLLLLSQVYK